MRSQRASALPRSQGSLCQRAEKIRARDVPPSLLGLGRSLGESGLDRFGPSWLVRERGPTKQRSVSLASLGGKQMAILFENRLGSERGSERKTSSFLPL